ncbi:carbamoyl-phosphate synthase (glutamine-hydrolyzing) large subunit [Halobacillus litoralis]|uniref:carbamoyl-phosphate synthase (glutamine-hydrolyzing) large subunit n=1 Tax=Halobacillus litoralis TaxID=45668 RepID=UPI001CD79BD8|nr:carbamoyl-phosphate synthase (glutamine-hydrolyzing) large subunit [Halobacillus litoralis]MCA0971232.1 carbamoyl-phosphate synthase (glutamine-hydrolyzing) large subunit [Halobacillus litoralis]
MSKKILVIGSGPIVIGQAAEFDYSGTQGCLALREEGHHVVLVNPNPATIMTDHTIADEVYSEPLTLESVTAIINKERPDGLLAGLGGQTALNLAVELERAGVLKQYEVELLGTTVDSIQKGEDRQLFRELMDELGEPVPESEVITTVDSAVSFAKKVGFPVISRPAYTLGGRGGGIAHNESDLKELTENGLKASPIQQVIMEKSIAGFKEIEYEIMRDQNGTCISVCNMENVDPVGVHTGDSIVVAPSQTLTDSEYQMLRSASFKIVSALEVIGGCNVQLALDPDSQQYYVIEVNPRVSRSSALASKATGYPIAKMATKIALGYSLDELLNPLTGHTYASFEPALDYVVVKFPRWPFDKFPEADRTLGTKMKATGEVMAIDRMLEAAFQKAIQCLDTKQPVINDIEEHLLKPTDLRFFAIMEAFRRGYTLEWLHEQTKVDEFFLQAIKQIIDIEQSLQTECLNEELLKRAKWFGFSDLQIAKLSGKPESEVKEWRDEYDVKPNFKVVDTCAAEFEAETNYVYRTYTGINEVAPLKENKKALIIGSGPIRIGQGVEFDYSAVKAIESLKALGWTTIMLNNNPETVSTDYETADRLYFEPITKEVIEDIVTHESVDLVFTAFGGQTAINMAEKLEQAGLPIAGVSSDVLDALEDRDRFYGSLDALHIPHVAGQTCVSEQEALKVADQYEYPLLCRPSYVIGGQGMVKVNNKAELLQALEGMEDHHYPVILDPFVVGKEIEVDLVGDGENVFIPGLMEHIEPAGVHSGDSMSVFPAQLPSDIEAKVKQYSSQIVQNFNYKGIMNIQFLWKGEDVYVLEVNPRASRTVPIVSKVSTSALVDLAVQVVTEGLDLKEIEQPVIEQVAVKYPLFSSHALPELDQTLGANMKSTGEGMCIGNTVGEALAKVFSHLPDLNEEPEAAFIDIESDTKGSTLPFKEWVQTKEASVYVNDQKTPEAKEKRVQALKYGMTVFSEKTTFQAYVDSIAYKKASPVVLPKPNLQGVESV